MTLARDVCFEHDELYYKFHIFNKKIMLMMTLLKMYVFFSCLVSYQLLIHPFQGCQKYSLIINSEDDSVDMWSCFCLNISYYLS